MPRRTAAPKRLPEALTEEEVAALLAQTDTDSRTGLRNQVAVLLMLRAGLRVSEVCNLMPSDLDMTARTLRVKRGKGAKDRLLYLDPQLVERLTLWLARRVNGSRWLLPVIRGGTRALGTAQVGGRLSPRYLAELVGRLGREANLNRQIHPHMLRHTYAVRELRRGVRINSLQSSLGHADLATTSVYLGLVDPQREADADARPADPLP